MLSPYFYATFCLYKIIFFSTFYDFLYIIMYILNIAKAIKKCQSMKSENVSLKTIINELNFLKKAVIIQWNVWKEKIYCCLLTNNRTIISVLSLIMLKNTFNHWWENKKMKTSKTIRNNNLSIKNVLHC